MKSHKHLQSQTPPPKPNPAPESESPGGPFGKSLSTIAKNIQQIEVEEIETIEDNTYPTFTSEPVVIKQTDFPRNESKSVSLLVRSPRKFRKKIDKIIFFD